MSDDYCSEDGPAFTKLDCGHWACCWDVDECAACREEAQAERDRQHEMDEGDRLFELAGDR